MDLLIALILSFLLLLVSSLKGVFIGYPLGVALIILVGLLWRRGYRVSVLGQFAVQGVRRAFPVLSVLLLIGVVIASWMAAGTVPALVYYGLQWLHPQTFLLMAFWLTSGVSLLIGTSFGTVGTIGIALMTIAQGSDLDPHWLAGAVIAGAYVGDRCSPMSSSALLIATITRTNLYDNLGQMWRTSGIPLLLSSLVYLGLSWWHPIHLTMPSLPEELARVFHVHPLLLLPAGVILGLSAARVEVKRAMLASAAVAVGLAIAYQHYSPFQVLHFISFGFHLETGTLLDRLLLGGGMWAMAKVSVVVVISTAFVGLFAGTRMLESLQAYVLRNRGERQRFLTTGLVGIGTAAFGCTQTIAILLTEQVMQPKYEESQKGKAALALDLENTVVVISPLIPWNIAGLVPATVLSTNAGFIPFACYLYLLPLANWLYGQLASPTKSHLCN